MKKRTIAGKTGLLKSAAAGFVPLCLCAFVPFSAAEPAAVTHRQIQAVHPDGTSLFDDTGPALVELEGVILNAPEDFLDPAADSTPGPWQMGGQWQIFMQGLEDDHAGTALWMGQNYGNGPGYDNYTARQWRNELCRLNHDSDTGYLFAPGDIVRVTGRYLFYKGKLNINENHETLPEYDFSVELLEPAAGLPKPELVSLRDLKDQEDKDIFDPDRLAGGEYYQSMLIRINDVSVTDPENWGPGSTVTISDGAGRTLPVLLGRGTGIGIHPCPAGAIAVIGILDQEAPGSPPAIDNRAGYRLFVPDYDGNGLVLTGRDRGRGDRPGDVNADSRVDMRDLAWMASGWLNSMDGVGDCEN